MGSSPDALRYLVPGSSVESVVAILDVLAAMLKRFAHASKLSADGAAAVVGASVDAADGAGVDVVGGSGTAAVACRLDPLEPDDVISVFCFLFSVPTSSNAIFVAFECRMFS